MFLSNGVGKGVPVCLEGLHWLLAGSLYPSMSVEDTFLLVENMDRNIPAQIILFYQEIYEAERHSTMSS